MSRGIDEPRPSNEPRRSDELVWDAIVIGGGPAGALAARQLALQGQRVLCVERREMPRPKVCGACLNGRAVEWLERVGLGGLLARLGAVPVRRFRLRSGGERTEIDLPGGAIVSREAFDAALVDAARQAGAVVRCGLRGIVEPLDDRQPTTAFRAVRLVAESGGGASVESGAARDERVAGRVVIAADGLGRPSLELCPEFRGVTRQESRVGVSTTIASDADRLEFGVIAMHVGRAGYAGVARLEDGRLNVAAAIDVAALRQVKSPRQIVERIVAEAGAPPLDLPPDGQWRGTLPLTQWLARPAGERVLVVGDAAGYVEPFTGEGMASALEGACLVAPLVERALREGWSSELERTWRRLHHERIGHRLAWCRRLAWLARRPILATWALRAVNAWPALCRPIVRSLNTLGPLDPAPASPTP